MTFNSRPLIPAIQLRLPVREFKWIHSHKLIGDFEDIIIKQKLFESLSRSKDFVTSVFNGVNGNSFSSLSDAQDFLSEAYTQIPGLNQEQLHVLLYISSFYGKELERQSTLSHDVNRLNQSGKFLINLFIQGYEHFLLMTKNPQYVICYDPQHTEFYFAKKNIAESMSSEDLAEYVSDKSSEIIRYTKFVFGRQDLYLRGDLVPVLMTEAELQRTNRIEKLNSKLQKRMLQNSEDQSLLMTQVQPYPKTMRNFLLIYSIKEIIAEHTNCKTALYQLFNSDDFSLNKLKTFTFHTKQRTLEYAALAKATQVMYEYLTQKSHITKIKCAEMISRLFALLKIFHIDSEQEIPAKYSDLPRFYSNNGRGKEYVRGMLYEKL